MFVPQPLREYISPQTIYMYCTESLVVHDGYNQLFHFLGKIIIVATCRWRVCLALVSKGLRFIDTFCNEFLGKRKPWSGILLYGVRHLFYVPRYMYILFLVLLF